MIFLAKILLQSSLALSESNFGINSNFWNQIFSHSNQLSAGLRQSTKESEITNNQRHISIPTNIVVLKIVQKEEEEGRGGPDKIY